MLFCWFISPTLLHNAMRKFGTFFWASRYIHTPWPCTNRGSVQWADLNWPQRSALTEYNSIVEASKSWHLYLVPQSQRNATIAPGGVHDCPNRWVFSRRWNVFSDSLLSRSADGKLFHTVDRGRWSCAGPPTSVLLAGGHIQLMPTAVEDVLELSPPARRILADMEVWCHGCISIRGLQSWKWSFAAPEASGGCVDLE